MITKFNTPPISTGKSSGNTIWYVLGAIALGALAYNYIYLPMKEKEKQNA